MSRRPKSSKHKRVSINRSKRRYIRMFVFVALFALIGTALLLLSFAAPRGGGGGGGYVITTGTQPNPTITPQGCRGGINIALVADVSGSIVNNGNPELSQMQQAFTSLVSALPPSTNVLFSLTEFDDSASVMEPFTSNATALDKAIGKLGGGGSTDWQAGLATGYGTFGGQSLTKPRLLVIATDGDPNKPNSNNEAINDAIVEANAIKTAPGGAAAHILAIGLGTDFATTNLEAISGSYDPSAPETINSNVITTSFGGLNAALLNLANGSCGGNGGTGTTGSGNGSGGTGNVQGIGGKGIGSGGTGQGTIGKSPSTAVGPQSKPQPSPNPAPTASTISNQPNSAPTATSQGTQTKPPTPQPSPFYDGKEYSPGSAVDKFATTASEHGIRVWWYLILILIILLPGSGFLLWRKRGSANTIKMPLRINKRTRSKK